MKEHANIIERVKDGKEKFTKFKFFYKILFSFNFPRFKFPCCNRVYPCDICHRDNNKDNHEEKLASKFYCGLCSRQLPISTKQCVCGNLFDNSSKQFWEGGKGNRDQLKMNRNDPRKFRGLSKIVAKK